MQLLSLLAAALMQSSPRFDDAVYKTEPTKDAPNESAPTRALTGATKVIASFTDKIKVGEVWPNTEMQIVMPHAPLLPNQEKIGETYFELQNFKVKDHYTLDSPNGKYEVFNGTPTKNLDIIGKAITKLWLWPQTVYGSVPENFPGTIQTTGKLQGGDYTTAKFQAFLTKNGLNNPQDSPETKLRKFYAFLAKNYNYDGILAKDDLLVENLITKKSMGCMSTSLLTATYLRSQNIPCFMVKGAVIFENSGVLRHALVCANISPYGWVTLDPTLPQSQKKLAIVNPTHFFVGMVITTNYNLFGPDKAYITRVGAQQDFMTYGLKKGGGGYTQDNYAKVQIAVVR